MTACEVTLDKPVKNGKRDLEFLRFRDPTIGDLADVEDLGGTKRVIRLVSLLSEVDERVIRRLSPGDFAKAADAMNELFPDEEEDSADDSRNE